MKWALASITILAFLSATAQHPNEERLDSTISIFWNQKLKIRVQVLDASEPNPGRNNAVLTLYTEENGSRKIYYKDSLFAYTILFLQKDFNGDGINDLLVYNVNNGEHNPSYHLYLVDQRNGKLTKVKGFQKLFNPVYDQKHCMIWGIESFDTKMILRTYIIDRQGALKLVTGI